MRTITIDLYQYDELNDKVKKKAREWFRESSAQDTFWSECVIEDAKECAKALGIDATDIYWSGFASQGDGACFVGSYASTGKAGESVTAHAPRDTELQRIGAELDLLHAIAPCTANAVTRGRNYCVAIDCDFPDDPIDAMEYGSTEWTARNDILRQVETDTADALRDFMHWIYRQLESAYDYENSDKTAEENIRCNEYTFTINGKREG